MARTAQCMEIRRWRVQRIPRTSQVVTITVRRIHVMAWRRMWVGGKHATAMHSIMTKMIRFRATRSLYNTNHKLSKIRMTLKNQRDWRGSKFLRSPSLKTTAVTAHHYCLRMKIKAASYCQKLEINRNRALLGKVERTDLRREWIRRHLNVQTRVLVATKQIWQWTMDRARGIQGRARNQLVMMHLRSSLIYFSNPPMVITWNACNTRRVAMTSHTGMRRSAQQQIIDLRSLVQGWIVYLCKDLKLVERVKNNNRIIIRWRRRRVKRGLALALSWEEHSSQLHLLHLRFRLNAWFPEPASSSHSW